MSDCFSNYNRRCTHCTKITMSWKPTTDAYVNIVKQSRQKRSVSTSMACNSRVDCIGAWSSVLWTWHSRCVSHDARCARHRHFMHDKAGMVTPQMLSIGAGLNWVWGEGVGR